MVSRGLVTKVLIQVGDDLHHFILALGAIGNRYAQRGNATGKGVDGVLREFDGLVLSGLNNSSTGMVVLSMLAVAIFSAFLLVDIKRIIDGGETNYITATLAIYLSLVNIFQNLLVLLGVFGGED